MNVRAAALAIANRLPFAIVVEHKDSIALVVNAGNSIVTIPEFRVNNGYILGEDAVGIVVTPPLSPDELLGATAMAVENYWHRLRGQLDASPDEALRTFITVSPDLDPETVSVGVYVFVAKQVPKPVPSWTMEEFLQAFGDTCTYDSCYTGRPDECADIMLAMLRLKGLPESPSSVLEVEAQAAVDAAWARAMRQ